MSTSRSSHIEAEPPLAATTSTPALNTRTERNSISATCLPNPTVGCSVATPTGGAQSRRTGGTCLVARQIQFCGSPDPPGMLEGEMESAFMRGEALGKGMQE